MNRGDRDADFLKRLQSQFMGWVKDGKYKAVQFALENGVDPTLDPHETSGIDSNGAIVTAFNNNDVHMATMLLSWRGSGPLDGKRVDPSVAHHTCLALAVSKNDPALIEALVKESGHTGTLSFLSAAFLDLWVQISTCKCVEEESEWEDD